MIGIFFVNYVVDGDGILFCIVFGSKLFELMVNVDVLFEVDYYIDIVVWSVIVRGYVSVLEFDVDV